EATSKDEVEIEKFLQEQKSKNTQYKTKSELNAWKKFCKSLKESRAIKNIPANELDLLLFKFFISVRKQNGTEYEPGTLSGFQRTFRSHRPEAMLEPDAPFYLAINHRRKPNELIFNIVHYSNDKVWYLDRPLGKKEIGKFLKDAFAAAKLDDTNKKVSNHSVRKTSVGRLLEADVQPNFVAQLSGHKNLKSLNSHHSASLKRQLEMSAILNRGPGTSAQSEENQVSTSTTTEQNVFTVQQIQPQAIFAGSHIDKFEGCTFNINVFSGDRSKIARLNDN
ncbi:unnamed protein product, partial [Porites evermanni]